MELFLLAQLDPDGAREANAVISELLKHAAEGTDMRNVSAFAHACARKPRHRPTSESTYTLICPVELGCWRAPVRWSSSSDWSRG
eukprot:7276879-Pyramimonas_sp.AAC.1